MWDIEFTSIIPIARHAYTAIGLAVKTSRPHNETVNLRFTWSNYALSISTSLNINSVEGPKTVLILFSKIIWAFPLSRKLQEVGLFVYIFFGFSTALEMTKKG